MIPTKKHVLTSVSSPSYKSIEEKLGQAVTWAVSFRSERPEAKGTLNNVTSFESLSALVGGLRRNQTGRIPTGKAWGQKAVGLPAGSRYSPDLTT